MPRNTADAIQSACISPNVPGRNMEPANLVDVIHSLSCSAWRIAESITPNVVGNTDASGSHVESLTEAVMGVTSGLVQIASAIERLAEAVASLEV